MRRREYEAQIQRTAVNLQASVVAQHQRQVDRLNDLLKTLNVKVEFYDTLVGYHYRIVDTQSRRRLVEGLNPAYANEGDYRQFILKLREPYA